MRWRRFPPNAEARRHVIYTAHSIPMAMADKCDYGRK